MFSADISFEENFNQEESIMQGVSGAGGLSPQYQIAALKTAQDTQKQEGEAVVNLIQDAVQATEHSITGNNIDVTA
jgi:hypothetical protein